MGDRKYLSYEVEDMNFTIHCSICELFLSNESHLYCSRKFGIVSFSFLKQVILLECMKENIDPDDDENIIKLVKKNTIGIYSIN